MSYVLDYLQGRGAEFTVIPHQKTAVGEAQTLHLPEDQVVKTLVVIANYGPALMVVPASRRLDMEAAAAEFQAGGKANGRAQLDAIGDARLVCTAAEEDGGGIDQLIGEVERRDHRDALQPRFFAAALDHVPDHVLRNRFAPNLSRPAHSSKNPSVPDPGSHRPLVERPLRPFRDRNRANVSALAD